MSLYNGKVTRKMAVNTVSVVAWNDETEIAEKTTVTVVGRMNAKKFENAVKNNLAKKGFSLVKIISTKTEYALFGCTVEHFLEGAEKLKDLSPDEVEEEDNGGDN